METISNFDERIKKHRTTFKMKKVIFGILVVAAGGLLLGFNLGTLDPFYRDIVFSWQALVIAIGLINIFDRDSFGFGLVALTVGGLFLAPEFVNLPFDVDQIFWPVIIMMIGLLILVKRRSKKHKNYECKEWKTYSQSEKAEELPGFVNENNVFGGSKRIFEYPVFKGGEINNVFGGSELDLSNAKLNPGTNVLEINSVFGGISLIVPADWRIHIKMDNVMGGFVDKRVVKNVGNEPAESELIIKGACVFGGGELVSV